MRQQFKLLLIFVLTLATIGVLQFFICTWIAIANFPGGYSMTENFLSDLGRQNTSHHATFNGSVIFLGISLIPSFCTLWLINTDRMWSMKVTAVFGIISSFGLIGLGLTSIDREFVLHHVALAIWLFPMMYMTVTFFFAASRSHYVGVWFIAASLVMVIVMITVLLQTEMTSTQLLQKAIVLCGFVWLFYVIAFIYQAGRYVLKHWGIRQDHSAEEDNYFTKLLTNKHRN